MDSALRTDRTTGGVRVITETVPGAVSSGFMVTVGTGSRDEDQNELGISHLLEHVVFRATKTRTSFQMSKEIEGAGGATNAFTAKESTAFFAVTIKDTADVAKSLVADIVCNPLIAAADVELEKKIVLQEISMVKNDPEDYIHELFDSVAWRDHPLSRSEAGTTKSVKLLTDKDLRSYYEDRYRVPNITVFGVGAVDREDVLAWAEENFDCRSGGCNIVRNVPSISGAEYKHFKRKDEHCYVGMGFRAYDAKSQDRAALQLLSVIIGAGTSSRLFQSVREQKALVYDINSYVDQDSDAGSMGTYFSATNENVRNAIGAVADVYCVLKDKGITDEELTRAKHLAKGELVRFTESTEHRLYRLARNTLLTGSPETLNDRLAAMDRVNCDDVMRVAADIMTKDRMSIALFGGEVKDMDGFDIDQIMI
jgi:predicted Zn-dependent peptidase